jgi:hypothetical protein
MCAAQASDKFKKVGAGTVTTLSAPGKAMGATSITVGSTANMPSDTGIVIAIRTVDTSGNLVAGTYTEYSATVSSGTSLALVGTPVYGNDQVYAAGSTTQVFVPVSAYANNVGVDGLLVSHNQDGTLKTNSVTTTNITDANVTDAKLATSANTTRKEMLGDFVQSGCVWGTSANLNASMTAGVAYINGRRLVITQITNRAFTASKDTYVDILDNLNDTYTVVYTEVANLAAEPSLAANSMRLALVRSTGAAISVVLTGRVKLGVSDGTGAYVMSPTNPLSMPQYSARLVTNAAQTITTTTPTVVNYGAKEYDPSSCLTLGAAAKYTVKVAGLYEVTPVLSWATNGTGGRMARIRKNGTALAGAGTATVGAADWCFVMNSSALYCAVGDTLDITAQQNSGGNLDLNSGNSWAVFKLIGQ